jgi:hypothetical protein
VTIADVVSLDVQVTVLFVNTFPAESRRTAATCTLSPSSRLSVAGVSVMLATRASTLLNVAVTLRASLITIVQPLAPVQDPVHASSALDAVGVAVSTTDVPAANVPVQVPDVQLMPAGVDTTVPVPSPARMTLSVCAGSPTVTVALPDCPPDDAVIVALPGATDVTVPVAPVPDTVATAVLLLLHATVGLAGVPALVTTVATNCPVTPAPVSVTTPGATLTDCVTTAGGVGPVFSDPHPLSVAKAETTTTTADRSER